MASVRALVTGATGFIGRRLVQALERPVVLSRDPQRARRTLGNQIQAFEWDPEAGLPPAESFRQVDTVFHLAGESIGEGRWNTEKKTRIRESRVRGTRNLVKALESLAERPKVLVSGSAIGFYGDRGAEVLDESAAPGTDFLAEISQAWEAEAGRARDLGIRVVTSRTGIVFGASGGALKKMLPPFKLGIGGRLGSGRQWMSWIHLDDLVGLLLHAAQTSEINGPMNGVAPLPVTNQEFTKTLASVLRRPAIFPVPKLALRVAIGEFASFLLASQRVVPRVGERTGYRFRYPTLAEALRDILGG